jgi:hypothetical protein
VEQNELFDTKKPNLPTGKLGDYCFSEVNKATAFLKNRPTTGVLQGNSLFTQA